MESVAIHARLAAWVGPRGASEHTSFHGVEAVTATKVRCVLIRYPIFHREDN